MPLRYAFPGATRCQLVIRAERDDVVQPPIPSLRREWLFVVVEERKEHRYFDRVRFEHSVILASDLPGQELSYVRRHIMSIQNRSMRGVARPNLKPRLRRAKCVQQSRNARFRVLLRHREDAAADGFV